MAIYNNPLGAIGIADGGTPRVITVKARENISGGYFVNGSSAEGVVSSGANSYAASDIEAVNIATQIGSQCIGLALTDIASGTYGPVAMRGIFLLPSASGTKVGSIFSGQAVLAGSAGTVLSPGSSTLVGLATAAGIRPLPIGRALTTGGADNEYVAVSLNL